MGRFTAPTSIVDTVYEFHPERHWVGEFYSSEILLVLPALALNSLLSKDGTFDLRLMGVVHSALPRRAVRLFAPLLANTARAVRAPYTAGPADVLGGVYVCERPNSFYMDEPAYLLPAACGGVFFEPCGGTELDGC